MTVHIHEDYKFKETDFQSLINKYKELFLFIEIIGTKLICILPLVNFKNNKLNQGLYNQRLKLFDKISLSIIDPD